MGTRVRRVVVALVAAALVAACGSTPERVVPTAVSREPALVRPNVVLILTDDQTTAEMRWMPKTRRLLGGHGTTFSRAMSPAPLCCPARAEIITGQYGQNNGVRDNAGPRGGYAALRHKDNTLAVWLQEAGYRTALIGKYLNGYVAQPVRGWTHWNPSVRGIYSYTHTTFLDDRRPRTWHRNVTPVMTTYATRYLREFARGRKPFFLWVSELPPHGRSVVDRQGRSHWRPPLASRRHRGVLTGARLPSLGKPSFNHDAGRGQPYFGRTRHPVGPRHRQEAFTGRVQALQDVDDAVARIVRVLRRTGELDRTVVVFASDNGYLQGEHRLIGKNVLYQEALRVPVLVRVPGAVAQRSTVPVTLADLAPTIVDLAGARARRRMDGRSFAPLLRGQDLRWRDTQLVQTGHSVPGGPPSGWDYRGVCTTRYTYLRRVDGSTYLFDRRRDPFETRDVSTHRAYRPVARELAHRLRVLDGCAGRACNRRFGPVPQPR